MSRPASTWKCRWKTLCPAEAPQLETTRNSEMPSSFVTLLMTSKQWATTAEFSGVISPQEVRVLCYPRDEAEGLSENAAFEYVQESIEQIARYLGLALKVLEVRRIAGLCDFAAENDAI